MAHDVFISHSTSDKPTADAVCALLESDGLRCWIAPRDISPGETWAGSIFRAVAESRVMVIILSKHANVSRHVTREVELAVKNDLVIVPFRTEDVEPAADLAYFLSSTHWLDAIAPPIEERIHDLAVCVRGILQHQLQPPASAAPSPSPAFEPKKRMRRLTFKEIDGPDWAAVYTKEVLPLIERASLESMIALVDGLSEVTLSYNFDTKLEQDLSTPIVRSALKQVCLRSISYYEKVVRILNSCFLLKNADVRQMIREVVLEYLDRDEISPLQIIYKVSVNPAPMSLVKSIYDLLSPAQKDKVTIVYQEYEDLKEKQERERP